VYCGNKPFKIQAGLTVLTWYVHSTTFYLFNTLEKIRKRPTVAVTIARGGMMVG